MILTTPDTLDYDTKVAENNLKISQCLDKKAMVAYWELKLEYLLLLKEYIALKKQVEPVQVKT